MTVTAPGLYYNLDENSYHADPIGGSLSHSGAKTLLEPGCPALFKHHRDNGGRPDKRAFDFGHAAHREVLGVGNDVVTVEADDWRSKAAKERAAAARADGKVPILTREMSDVQAMAAAIRQHPLASRLLHPDSGQPEVSAFWLDQRSGVTLRARYDWLRTPHNGRLIIADYKSATTAEPWTFGRTAASYGYHTQAAWYMDGAKALNLADDIAFMFVVQEKTRPYLVSVVELDHAAIRSGRARNRRAIDTYADCAARDEWPAYTDREPALVSLPAWATREDNL